MARYRDIERARERLARLVERRADPWEVEAAKLRLERVTEEYVEAEPTEWPKPHGPAAPLVVRDPRG